MAEKRILVVEDERKIARLIQDYLEKEGFRVMILFRGDEVIPQVKRTPPDLIILDVMLPKMDGMAVCRELRKFSAIPVIMLTARVDEIDRLLGLELGADDYICKPFSPREVVARVKAVLRRYHLRVVEPDKIVFGPFKLDDTRHYVSIDDRELNLTPSEFKILKAMLAQPEKAFSRSELIIRVQGYEFEGYERTIDSHIKNLRKKIAAFQPGRDVILSIYGVGYKLKA
jgi:two-component system, OmpR family, response regulator BaeR